MTRLQRFRAYIARMNPAADPARAMEEGLYVPRPGSVVEQLVLRLELEPVSTHLVLGGIGAGKTTELLAVRDRLRVSFSETGDHVEYLDVGRRHDLRSDRLLGVPVALAGLSLIERRDVMMADLDDATAARLDATAVKRAQAASHAIRRHAHSRWEHIEDVLADERREQEEYNGALVQVGGVLKEPERTIPSHLEKLSAELRILREAPFGDAGHVVFLFDSLDRLPSPERFHEAVEDDLRVLKAAGIGAVVVGPIRFMFGYERAIEGLFDQTHFLLAPNPGNPQGLEFLQAVLRRRADPEVLPDECLEPIARASGGVLRDLISLAKSAGAQAFAEGHKTILRADVERAVDTFGRDLALGLDDERVKSLRHLERGGAFVIRGELELSLMETRRVLFYGASNWAVHPALAPLLAAIPEAA